MHSKLARWLYVVAWLGVAVEGLLAIHVAKPNASQELGLAGPATLLLPYRHTIGFLAFGLLLAACLLEGARQARAGVARLTTDSAPEGEGLHWRQPHFGGPEEGDWFSRVSAVYAGLLPVLFLGAIAYLLLSAPGQPLLLLLAAMAAHWPAKRLGSMATYAWLLRSASRRVSVGEGGVSTAGALFLWERLACYEVGDGGGVRLFARPLPKAPLLSLRPPEELYPRVLATVREHLPAAAPEQSAAWRRKLPVWLAQTSGLFVLSWAAIACGLLIAQRSLACAVLGVAYYLCEHGLGRLVDGIGGLSAARGEPGAAPASEQRPKSPELPARQPRGRRVLANLSAVLFAAGLGASWAAASWAREWRLVRYLDDASFVLLGAALAAGLAEWMLARRG